MFEGWLIAMVVVIIVAGLILDVISFTISHEKAAFGDETCSLIFSPFWLKIQSKSGQDFVF